MKRFKWVALLAAAMIVCASGIASAAWTRTETFVLVPASSDSDAGGLGTLTVYGPYFKYLPWGGKVKVYLETWSFEVWGLTPNTRYDCIHLNAWYWADENGSFSGTYSVEGGAAKPNWFSVGYYDDGGRYVAVLNGAD